MPACAPRNFENFVQAAVKRFPAMNEPTQSLSARAARERCRTRLDGPKVDIRGLGSTVVVPLASTRARRTPSPRDPGTTCVRLPTVKRAALHDSPVV